MQAGAIVNAFGLQAGMRILDLGCGAGRHSDAFSKMGFEVLGVDQSSELIAQAKKRGSEAKFLCADFYKESFSGFDVVINLFTSFGYFETDQENADLFDKVRQALVPGGFFFLDYLHPEGVRRSFVKEENLDVEGEPVKIQRMIEGDFVFKKIMFPGKTYLERVKLYTKDQVEQMAKERGFTPLFVWDDYLGNPWRNDGNRQIFGFAASEK